MAEGFLFYSALADLKFRIYKIKPQLLLWLQFVEKVFHWDMLLLYHSAIATIASYR